MKAITQRESVVTYIKSCLIFQIPRFMLISKYRVISPLSHTDLQNELLHNNLNREFFAINLSLK